MKILLLGEYSGLFNCLKDGLIALGHEVVLASDGDGFKNYPSDISWRVESNGYIFSRLSQLKAFSLLRHFTGFDVVHVISPLLICTRPFWGPFLFSFLKKNNGSVFLSGAGMTANIYKYWLSHPEEKYYKYVLGYIEEARGHKENVSYASTKWSKSEEKIMSLIDGYIPIMHEYSYPFNGSPKLLNTIPIPINLLKYTYSPNIVEEKIIFFHGLTKKCKGGEQIIRAFNELRDKYSRKAEFIIKGGIPFNEYIQLLKKVNIIVDDANAYSLGMNSLFSMAQGRIAMGGAEKLANDELGYSFCPAINLTSDVEDIKNKIELLIDKKPTLLQMGEESRLFVEKNHDHILIANKYIEAWTYNGKK